MKIVHTQDAPSVDTKLTAAELLLLRSFRNLKDDCQDYALDFMEMYSANPSCQRVQQKPSLRVITNGMADRQ